MVGDYTMSIQKMPVVDVELEDGSIVKAARAVDDWAKQTKFGEGTTVLTQIEGAEPGIVSVTTLLSGQQADNASELSPFVSGDKDKDKRALCYGGTLFENQAISAGRVSLVELAETWIRTKLHGMDSEGWGELIEDGVPKVVDLDTLLASNGGGGGKNARPDLAGVASKLQGACEADNRLFAILEVERNKKDTGFKAVSQSVVSKILDNTEHKLHDKIVKMHKAVEAELKKAAKGADSTAADLLG